MKTNTIKNIGHIFQKILNQFEKNCCQNTRPKPLMKVRYLKSIIFRDSNFYTKNQDGTHQRHLDVGH